MSETATQTATPRFSKVDNPASTPAVQQTEQKVNTSNQFQESYEGRKTDAKTRESLLWTGKEQETPKETVKKEEKTSSQSEKPKLILGKYKDQSDLEKAYVSLKKEYDRKAQLANKFETTQGELEQLRQQVLDLKKQTAPSIPDETQFNQALATDPAKAIREELARQRALDDLKQAELRQAQEIERIKGQIAGNITSMETEYPEFRDHKEQFAQWMTYYGMDTTAIMADKEKALHAYRDFIDANSDYTEVAKQQVREEIVDKLQQVPAYEPSGAVVTNPITKSSNSRFTRLDDAAQDQGGKEKNPVDLMEAKMSLGPQYRMF